MRNPNAAPKDSLTPLVIAGLGGIAMHYFQKQREIKRRLVETEYESTHDKLTGLLNTRGLEKLIAESKLPRALLYIDSTNQKKVNDVLGHDRGDEAIIGTADIIAKNLRPGDIGARIGGDEFLILLDTETRQPSQKPSSVHSSDDILSPVMSRMYQAAQDFLAENADLKEIGFDIAIGGVVAEEGMSVPDMRKAAEENMYEVKEGQHATNGQYR